MKINQVLANRLFRLANDTAGHLNEPLKRVI
jgi:hypothetical protein